MRELNIREKILGALTLTACLAGGWYQFQRRAEVRIQQLEERLARAEARKKEQTEILAVLDRRPTAALMTSGDDAVATRTLLQDLTAPAEAGPITFVTVDRSAERTFKLTLEGRFPAVMRFVSYLERGDGRFLLGGGEIARVVETANTATVGGTRLVRSPDAKRVRAILNLSLRG